VGVILKLSPFLASLSEFLIVCGQLIHQVKKTRYRGIKTRFLVVCKKK